MIQKYSSWLNESQKLNRQKVLQEAQTFFLEIQKVFTDRELTIARNRTKGSIVDISFEEMGASVSIEELSKEDSTSARVMLKVLENSKFQIEVLLKSYNDYRNEIYDKIVEIVWERGSDYVFRFKGFKFPTDRYYLVDIVSDVEEVEIAAKIVKSIFKLPEYPTGIHSEVVTKIEKVNKYLDENTKPLDMEEFRKKLSRISLDISIIKTPIVAKKFGI